MGLVLFASACLLGAELGQIGGDVVRRSIVPALWPPAGVMVGTLLLTDRARWTALLVTACGALLASALVLHGQPALPAAGLTLLVAAEAAACAWLVRRTIEPPFALDHVSHASALVIASIAVTAGGALVAPLLHAGAASFLVVSRARWLADLLGVLLFAPMVSAAISERPGLASAARSWKTLEMVLVFAGTGLLAQSIFGGALDPLLRVPAYVLPLLLWPVFRFGPGGACASLVIVSFIGLRHAALGQGPLAMAADPGMNVVLRSQGAAVIAAVSFLLVASVVAERRRIARENVVLIAELQTALAEVKTLQGFIPICAWCHKVRDDAGFWQRIEEYIGHRTDATFSHSICPVCVEQAEREIGPDEERASLSEVRGQ